MPVYAYRGLLADGKSVNGVIDADSARAARSRLRRDGVFPTDVAEERKDDRPLAIALRRRESIPVADLAMLSRQLATLIGAGVPVVEALAAIGEQHEKPTTARILSHVRDQVTQGSALADAMAEHPGAFPDLYVGMVRAGEAAGALEVVLERLATYSETQNELQSKVRSALAYPFFMSLVSFGIVVFLLAFVVPKVTKIFEDQAQSLPLLTKILLAISDVIAQWWPLGLLALFAAAAGVLYARQRPAGRLWMDRWFLGLPLVGPVLTKVAAARFARTLSTMLQNGIPLLSALEVASTVTGNHAMMKAVEEARGAIREGQSVAAPLKQSGLFPSLLIRMIGVGERSGELEGMLNKAADGYEQEVEGSLAALTAVLQPVMIVVMAGLVLFIILAILLPIFEINAMVR